MKEEFKWDVPLGTPITYFDRSLSYELTGYRPIDMTNGLDFKVEWFNEDARTKTNSGKYSTFAPDSKPYNDFWDERYERCTNGMTVNGYTLTGDNYFFINFYRMISAADASCDESFPTFTNVQYEWFHYVDMCEKLKKDCVALKPRGINSCPTN